jgi:Cu-Zn family superoxide dismutase
MRSITTTAAVLTLALAACGSPDDNAAANTAAGNSAATSAPQTASQRMAVANLQTADGQGAGTATATASGDQVQIALDVRGLPAGEHGVHVHTVGACEGPAFDSAGGHWNPTDQTHGLESGDGQHAGDMPNLTVGEDGTGRLEYTLEGGATFEGLMDADGSAFMVHAMRDDQTTDPSGDSGSRIACGVFQAG